MNKIQYTILKQKLALQLSTKQVEEAEKTAQQMLRLTSKSGDSKDPELILTLAQLNEQKQRYERAVGYYHDLSTLQIPSETKIWALEKSVELCSKHKLYKLGLVMSEALITAKPDDTKAIFFYGLFNYHTKYLLKAIKYLQRAHERDINNIWCLNFLAISYTMAGQAEKALEHFTKSYQLDDTQSINLYNYNFVPSFSENKLTEAHQRFGALLEKKLPPHKFNKNTSKAKPKIRIGYSSSCFYWHSVSYFFKAALEGSSREKYEIFCYSDTSKQDEMTEILKSKSDHWFETKDLSDTQLFDKIIHDKIDILIDLTGYTEDSRMAVFARKAAPIQVTYLGYPNTTGLTRIDYRLTDKWADTDHSDAFYTEKLLRMDSGFLCYYPDKVAPEVGLLPALKNQGTVCFGSFNAFQKVNHDVIALWSKVLKSIQNSTLLIKAGPLHDAEFCTWVYKQFEEEGIEHDRIELLGWTSDKRSHLALYDKVDIHLDTFPYNGTTTTCEALWQGVPTLTLAGDMHRERVGVSILSQLGLNDFIAETPEDYIEIAIKQTNNLEALSALRSNMRAKMKASPLMDVEGFSKSLSDAYSLMFQRYLNGDNTEKNG